MPKAETGAVQELSGEAVAPGMAVSRIARHRVADRREVRAHLMRAPGLQTSLHQRVLRQELEDLEVGACLARGPATDRPALRGPVVAPERRVDGAGARAGTALDQRQVATSHLVGLDLGREP